jgi:cytochrome b561
MSLVHPAIPSVASAVPRHPKWTIRAHWLSALAIGLVFGLGWLRELVDGDALRALLLGVHRQVGLLVLLLWVVRLLVRLTHPLAPSTAHEPWVLRWAATAAHGVLYLVLLAMPLLGWAMTNAQGHELLLLGALPLPHLVSVDPDLADSLQEWHERGSWLLLGLVGAHLGAAVWHHWVRRDGVLAAMAPWLQPRAPRTQQS